MIILQIAPVIAPGTGVGSVAYHLEQEWAEMGHDVRRFTLTEARGDWIPRGTGPWSSRLGHAARVVWFSTAGTLLARRAVAALPAGAVAVCHNDALAGHVYVNHGVLAAAMRARGRFAWRMVRNPLHLFTTARDALRFATRTHAVVVSLARHETAELQRTYPALVPRATVIPNGVDLQAFEPASPSVRAEVRRSLGLPSDAVVLLFVGHEFERKGLFVALEALGELPSSHHLLVVGGTDEAVRDLLTRSVRAGVAERVTAVGRQGDSRQYYGAADVLLLPSSYEADPLVVLEALASGVPVVATDVGGVADIVEDGRNGYVVERTPPAVAAGVRALCAQDMEGLRARARASAQTRSWARVAGAYLEEFQTLMRGSAS